MDDEQGPGSAHALRDSEAHLSKTDRCVAPPEHPLIGARHTTPPSDLLMETEADCKNVQRYEKNNMFLIVCDERKYRSVIMREDSMNATH